MKKHFMCALLLIIMALLLCFLWEKEEISRFVATASVDSAPEVLDNVIIDLPESILRETISNIQHDFLHDGKQVGGIVIVDIPNDLLDSPRERLLEIVELLRNQLMPDVPAEKAQIISWGGNQNAYMELVTGPDEMAYFHFLFRGANNVYDVWFDWELLDQNSDMIYEIVNSVTGEDILPENNQNPF